MDPRGCHFIGTKIAFEPGTAILWGPNACMSQVQGRTPFLGGIWSNFAGPQGLPFYRHPNCLRARGCHFIEAKCLHEPGPGEDTFSGKHFKIILVDPILKAPRLPLSQGLPFYRGQMLAWARPRGGNLFWEACQDNFGGPQGLPFYGHQNCLRARGCHFIGAKCLHEPVIQGRTPFLGETRTWWWPSRKNKKW